MSIKTYLFLRNCLLFLLLILFYQVKAQETFEFERLDSSDGLSDNEVLCIHQDKEGFMWIGSFSGLNRYDGNSFKTFRQENSDKTAITDLRVEKIDEDNFGHLWLKGFVGTYRMFDKSTHTTKVFPNEFGYYPTKANPKLFLHKDGFAVLALEEFGIFVIDTKEHPGALLGKFLFDEKILKNIIQIRSVYAKDLNNIWLSTSTGPLQLKINPVTSNYQYSYLAKSQNQRTQAKHYETAASLYFVAPEKGLLILDLATGATKIIESINGINLKKPLFVTGYQNKLWISTQDQGILGISDDGQELLFHIKDLHNSPLHNITRLDVTKKGDLWFYAAQHEEIVYYQPKNAKTRTFSFPTRQINLSSLLHFFEEDSDGNLWIGTAEDGLFFYDYSSGQAQNIRNNPKINTSLITNSTLSFKEDHNKTIWIGTKFGISKKSLKKNNFNLLVHNSNPLNQFDNSTNALYKDSYGNLWCGTRSNELYVYDSQLKLKHVFPNKERSSGFEYARTYSFCEDAKGRLWIGTKGEGLYYLDLKKHANNLNKAQFIHFSQNGLHNEFYDIVKDSQDRMWFASFDGGLHLLLEKNEQLSFINYNQFLDPYCPFSVQQGRCLLEDKQGKMWYGGVNGLISFNVDNKEQMPRNVNYYSSDSQNQNNAIAYSDVSSLYEDKEGIIWIGTNGGGLNSFHPKTKKINQYTTVDGLPNSIVYSTINDAKGNLWIPTENGLSKFNTNKNTFTNYTTADGLSSNGFTETKPFFLNNKLFLGTIKGVTSFSPSTIDANVSYPDILFTDFLISNTPIEPSSSGPLTQDINLTKSIVLEHNQNDFTCIFSTSNYNTNTKGSLEYKLENFNTDWIRTDKNSIVYTNIPPGEYKLKLRYSKVLEGLTSPQKELTIIITPPLWKTGWAYILYILLISVALYIIITIGTRIKVLRNSLKLKQELNDFKLQFFTKISHELRTPLTLIINPVKEIIRENTNLNSATKKYLDVAYNNANSLLRLVNQILDFRKLQIDKVQLQVSEVELVSFFYKITNNFNFVADRKAIEFKNTTNVSEHLYWIDPEKLEKVIINLLTNAFKFTAQKGKVSIQLLADNQSFTLVVEDTGQGMDQEQRAMLFERYYKVKSSYRSLFAQGAGIGLSIVEEFVKLHHGTIDVESEPEKGTKFTVSIPGQKKGYAKEDIAAQNIWMVGSESGIIEPQMESKTLQQQEEQPNKKAAHSILLVEDNEELLSMLEQKLCQYYKVYTAVNGVEGLKAVKKHQPDLVVTDVMMPLMNGIEMAKTLKNNFDTCHIPVIMLTAKSSNDDKVKGYDSGADSYISKPFDFDVLISRISNLQGQRKLLKQKFSNDVEFDARSVAIEKQDQEFIDTVISYVKDQMGNEDFILQDMYTELGFSKTVFYNKIKALTALSPNQFVRTIKLKEAGKLLKTSNLSISEAAFKVGYTDINYFRTQFKKQFKVTPSEFMKGA
jgi:signal transduction histidine kinase/ligand-binding sensor domain-containing protein/CheY-like chemotaxis protein